MVLKCVVKRALNANYIKMHVDDDLVTVFPLKNDGLFI